MIGLEHYLLVSGALLSLGILGLLTRRNAVNVHMSIEERGDDIYLRPDLAASGVRIEGDAVIGAVHNIGSADAGAFEVRLVDSAGKLQQRVEVPGLAAPLDCVPRRKEFRFSGVAGELLGWSVTVDPDDRIVEIFEGNNRLLLRAADDQ